MPCFCKLDRAQNKNKSTSIVILIESINFVVVITKNPIYKMKINEISSETVAFIAQNLKSDVQTLALKGGKTKGVDMTFALSQIKGHQTSCAKLPLWAATKGVIFPVTLSLEQCSSQQTAEYKAQLLHRLSKRLDVEKMSISSQKEGEKATKTLSLTDLTGGFGVDFTLMAKQVSSSCYVEQQQVLCDIAENNLPLLGVRNFKVMCCDGEKYLNDMNGASFIFLDPARRDASGAKTVEIEQCTPNVLALKETLLQKCCVAIVKLSPMLDWHKALKSLNEGAPIVSEIHIVSVQNECKELLFVLQKNAPQQPQIYCVNDQQVMSYSPTDNEVALQTISTEIEEHSEMLQNQYLYEPNASQMKAGCFAFLSQQYGVKALSANSHLFVSPHFIENWHGRKFKIQAVSSLNKKELKTNFAAFTHANVAVRNFPLSANELRKRLKLKEGGSFLFGTTLGCNTHILLMCSKE